MPPPRSVYKRVDPELGSVAKIIMNSARRAGVITAGLESVVERDYARHLLRFQAQTKRRGGTLEGVSSRIAAAVSSMPSVKPMRPAMPTAPQDVPPLFVPSAKKRVAPAPTSDVHLKVPPLAEALPRVPSLDISVRREPMRPAAAERPEAADAKPLHAFVEEAMEVHIPQQPPPMEPVAAALEPEEAQPSTPAVTTPTATVAAAEIEPQQQSQRIFIPEEQRPTIVGLGEAFHDPTGAFEEAASLLRQAAATEPASAPLVFQQQVERPVLVSERPVPTPPPTPLFVAPEVPVAAPQAPPEPVEVPPAALTPDDWMQQREHELAELHRQEQLEEEERQAAALRAEIEKEAEDWAQSRPQPQHIHPKHYAVLHDIYFARTAEEALSKLTQFDSEPSNEVARHMVELAASKTLHVSVEKALDYLNAVAAIAEKHKLPPTSMLPSRIDLLFRLRKYSAIFFAAKPLAVPQLCLLPRRTIYKIVVASVVARGWRSGLQFLDSLKKHIVDPFCFLEQQYLIGVLTGGGNRFGRLKAIQAIEIRLRERMGEIGKMHAILISRGYSSLHRFDKALSIARQFKEKGELDESFCAALLSNTDASRMAIVDELMKKMSFDLFHPVYITAKMHGCISTNRAKEAWELFENMRTSPGFTWSYAILGVLRRCASRLCQVEIADAIIEGAEKLGTPLRAKDQSIIFPIFVKNEKFEEIVAIHRRSPLLPLEAGLSLEGENALNTALRAMGFAPLRQSAPPPSEAPTATVPQKPIVAVPRAPTPPPGTSPAPTPSTSVGAPPSSPAALPSLEIMLEIAKDRNWAEAEKWLDQLLRVTLTPEQGSTATLLFNCALTSAIDEPAAVDRILTRMQAAKAVPNSTTYNTIMSCFSRTEDRWEAACETFRRMPLTLKDATTYSIVIALFGKHNLWENAVEAVKEMKDSTATKPSPVVYSLAIQATHKHNWEATFGLFKEMQATHGPRSIKEIVAARVVRSLESAQRTKELQEVNEMMAAATTKKKVKKK